MAFVGREPELARLAGALERAAGGDRSKIALVGPAGVGLTRLLDEVVLRLVGLPGLVVARGAAQQPRAGEPYAAVRDALATLLAEVPPARLDEIVGPAASALAPLLPELAGRLGAGPLMAAQEEVETPLTIPADQAGGRFCEAVVGLFERLAGAGTTLLILEDLHWADPGTRQLVETLLRIRRPARFCLVLTYRPQELHLRHPAWSLAQAIQADAEVETVEVQPLARAEVGRLLEAVTGQRPAASFVAMAMEGSAGIPLLVEHLAATRAGGFHVRLSEPFEEVLRARLEPLSQGARRCLRLLAAARRPLRVGLLRQVEVPGGRLPLEAVEEAVASGLALVLEPGVISGGAGVGGLDGVRPHGLGGGSVVAAAVAQPRSRSRPQPRSRGRGRGQGQGRGRSVAARLAPGQLVGLSHDRYAEALEAMGLPAEQQPIHAALARVLTDAPAEQAWHLEAAMRLAEARNAHLAAALQAEAIEPGGTTLSHYLRVLELAEAHEARVPGLSLPLPLLLARTAEAAFAGSQAHRAASLLEQAIAVSTAAVNVERAARVRDLRRALEGELGAMYVRLGQYRSAAGDLSAALAALETAVDIVPAARAAERATVFAALAQQLMLDGRFEQSARAASRVRDLAAAGSAAATSVAGPGSTASVDGPGAGGPAASTLGPDAGGSAASAVGLGDVASATCTLGVDRAYLGDVEGGLALLEEATEMAWRAGRLDDLMRAYANRMLLLEMHVRLEAALEVARNGLRACRQWGGEAAYGALLRGSVAGILMRLGHWAEAEAEARAALDWSPGRLAAFPLHILGTVIVESRADDDAGRVVGQILLQLEEAGEGQWNASIQRLAVSQALWRDDPAEALRVARRAWDQLKTADDWREVVWAASTTAEAAAALAEAARPRHDVVTVASMAELAAGVTSEAQRQLARAHVEAGDPSSREPSLEARTAILHLRRCRGRPDPAAWGEVADGWRELHMPYPEAKARWWQAEAALQLGDRATARTALQEAWALATALPARPLMAELRRLAGRARIRLAGEPEEPLDGDPAGDESGGHALVAVGPGPVGTSPSGALTRAALEERLRGPAQAPADPFKLTPRELEVLGLIVQGGTNRDIAQRLFISERTVAVHVRNILAKLGVAGRIEAANVAIRLGLVAVPSSVRLAPGL